MPGQKKDQGRTVRNEAGGLSGRTWLDKGNPWPRHRHTLVDSDIKSPITHQFYKICSECGLEPT